MRLIDADAYEYPGDLVHMPTIDAEPAVRCKECVYYQEGNIVPGVKFCYRLKGKDGITSVGYNFSPDDFCSRGVKRDAEPKPPEPHKVCPATGLECIECVPGYGCAKTEGGAE